MINTYSYLQLGLITEERDQLRNAVNELRKQKNVEAGDETVTGNLLQVAWPTPILFIALYCLS